LTRPDVNGSVVDLLPANVSAAKEFLAKNRKNPELILEYLNNGKPRPLSPRYLEVSDIEMTLIQDVLSGVDVNAAAKKARTAIDQLSGG
jgi:multiple sugar transport system substrate-binding protein